MQIHDLNNYDGALDAGSYVAVDNGSDTGKVSISQLFQATKEEIENVDARIDNIITSPAPTDAEIIDARRGADGEIYASLGDAIRTPEESLYKIIYEKTISGTNGYYTYFPCELIVGDKYSITNNTSGSGTVATTDNDNTRIETISPNIDPGETIVFSPTLAAAKLRVWFNATGSYELINTSKIAPQLVYDVNNISAEVTENAQATEILIETSKNLLNPADLTITGQYYSSGTGQHSSDATYKSYATPIEVEPSTPYIYTVNGLTTTQFVTLVELDENMSKVAGGYNQPGSFTTQATTKYLLITIEAAVENQQLQLEKGSTPTAYEPYFAPRKTTQVRIDLDNVINSSGSLKNKKICSFGDSLAAGDNGDRTSNTWIKIIGNYFGATPYNRGIGSSCVTDENSSGVARVGYSYVDADGDAGEVRVVYNTPRTFADYPTEISPWMCDPDRANTIPLDTNIVVIIAGTNDIGTVTLAGFKSAYKAMLNNIIMRVPNAKIYPCTLPFQQTYDLGSDADKATYNSYRNAIKEIAEEYGFEYIDLRSEMGVNAQNYSTYMNDATHYATTKGKKRMAECIAAHLKNACFC